MFSQLKNPWFIAVVAVLAGAAYGILNYFIFRAFDELFLISFLVLVPLVVGVVAALLSPRDKPAKAYQNAALAIFLIALCTTLWQYESLFCWIILAPIALSAALVGSFIVTVFRKRSSQQSNLLFSLMLLPVLALPIESNLPSESIYQTTHNSILIEASAETVWQAIKSVPIIQEHEYTPSWTQRLGLPRPLDASLSHEGVGGIRTANFSNGLSFLEEVSDWQPNKTLAFSIEAQGNSSERKAFALGPDIGGDFVDVTSGRYHIEVLDDTKLLLHLVSTQRLTSTMNSYAGFWVNAVMSDLQSSILQVIKKRSELSL